MSSIERQIDIHPSEYQDKIKEMAEVYVRVFGDTHGVYEGGLHEDGTTIPLSTYINCAIISSNEFSDLVPQVRHDTETLAEFVRRFEDLNPLQQEELIKKTQEISGGYSPFYRLVDVVNRFEKDLTPREDMHPIVQYFHDENEQVRGFAFGVNVDNWQAILDIYNNAPFLTRTHPDLDEQLLSFFSKVENLPDKVFVELEAAMDPEKRGLAFGKMLYTARRIAHEMGADMSICITFRDSEYYKSGIEKGSFKKGDFTTRPTNGVPMQVVFIDLNNPTNLGIRNT